MDRENELRFIREEFKLLGLKDFHEKEVADKIKDQADKFELTGSIPFSQHGAQNELYYKIFLKMYERPNLYHPYMYQATLKDQPERTRAFRMSQEGAFNLLDAFNLLNGRAVLKMIFDFSEKKMQSTWFQMEFNKTDIHGNFEINKLAVADNEFNILSAMNKYPIKELMNTEDRIKLLLSLFKGNAEPVTVLKNGKEEKGFVQAAPRTKTVDVYIKADKQLVKVNPEPAPEKEWVRMEQPMQVNRTKRKGRSF